MKVCYPKCWFVHLWESWMIERKAVKEGKKVEGGKERPEKEERKGGRSSSYVWPRTRAVGESHRASLLKSSRNPICLSCPTTLGSSFPLLPEEPPRHTDQDSAPFAILHWVEREGRRVHLLGGLLGLNPSIPPAGSSFNPMPEDGHYFSSLWMS